MGDFLRREFDATADLDARAYLTPATPPRARLGIAAFTLGVGAAVLAVVVGFLLAEGGCFLLQHAGLR
jgi:hypothetical protein